MAKARQAATLDEAKTHYEHYRLAEAEAACEAIVARDKRDVNAWQLLGLIDVRRGFFAKAAPHFEKVVKLRPEVAMSHCQLASAHMYQGKFDQARRGFEFALSREPGNPVAVRGLAEMEERSGDLQAAIERLTSVAEDKAADPETLLQYATLTEKTGRSEDALAIAHRALARGGVQAATRRKLGFVIGKAYDRLARYDEAFDAYRRANETGSLAFDVSKTIDRFDRLIEFFSAARVPDLPRADTDTELPVFIVGLPRSGSTLVEQIIDAHPLAHGAGELRAFLEVQEAMPKKIGSSRAYPEWIDDVPAGSLPRLGRPYLNHLARHCRDAARVADKNLLNYIHLGLIAMLYPKAHVIHTHRDPLDTAISCFINDLSPTGFPWSARLLDIGRYACQYRRLIDHWRTVLDMPILDLSYEEMIDDQDAVSRRIIDFCGLEWDDACLRFYETGRVVTTLSYDQVRKPIYRSALKRWQRYEQHLGPLREGLGIDA